MRHLSPSQISTYRRCSMQWWFRYVAGLKMKPTGKMTRGSATHFGIETGYQEKSRSGALPPLSVVEDATAGAFDQARETTQFEDGEKPDELKDESVKLTGLHYKEIAPAVDPLLVEQKMTAVVAGIPLHLVVDVITQDTTVIDNKVAGRKLDETALQTDVQLASYAIGVEQSLGIPVKAVRLDRLIATKIPGIQQIALGRTQVDESRLVHVAQAVSSAIEGGVFMPCDDIQTCSWCGYRKICWGARWADYLKDPSLARKAAAAVLAGEMMPEAVRTVPTEEVPA